MCIVHLCLCSYPNQYERETNVCVKTTAVSFTLQPYYYLLYCHSDIKITNEDKLVQTKA